jgi:hypothetical protein
MFFIQSWVWLRWHSWWPDRCRRMQWLPRRTLPSRRSRARCWSDPCTRTWGRWQEQDWNSLRRLKKLKWQRWIINFNVKKYCWFYKVTNVPVNIRHLQLPIIGNNLIRLDVFWNVLLIRRMKLSKTFSASYE